MKTALRHASWIHLLAVAALAEARVNSSEAQEASQDAATILYVDDDAPPAGDGSSWQTAFRYLQDALAVVEAGEEIRIAQGRYKPDQGGNQTLGDRQASFFLVEGVTIKGGYAGITEPDPHARDLKLYVTILDGDLLGDDPPYTQELSTYIDNSYSVIRAIGLGQMATLDGLRIRGGSGGWPPKFEPYGEGGGLYAVQSRIAVKECHFTESWGGNGGGAAVVDCMQATIQHCVFTYNIGYIRGGGLMVTCLAGNDLVIQDCVFAQQNVGGFSSRTHSGGIHLDIADDASDPVIDRCDFWGNYALHNSAGAGCSHGLFSPILRGIYRDCTFIGNNSDHIGGVSAKMLINCHVGGNHGIYAAGGASVESAINTRFYGNVGGHWGGGGAWAMGGEFINCEFVGNSTWLPGGYGAAAWLQQSSRFINCLFNGNESFEAGAIATASNTFATLITCSFTNNSGSIPGTALWGQGVLRNCIVWNHGPDPIVGDWDAQYSCIQGDWPGVGNIFVDPLFVDPFGPDGMLGTDDDDLRLSVKSSCIDAGDNSALPPDTFDLDGDGNTTEPVPIDLHGNLRRVNAPGVPNSGYPPNAAAVVDMGCLEFVDFKSVYADVTGDGVVNVNDLLAIINGWGVCPDSQDCELDLAPFPGGDGVVNHHDLIAVLMNWG